MTDDPIVAADLVARWNNSSLAERRQFMQDIYDELGKEEFLLLLATAWDMEVEEVIQQFVEYKEKH